jgi:predicted metal-dependent hydrolase
VFGIKIRKKAQKLPLEIAGVRVRSSRRARRLALHMDMKAGEIVLTWPVGMPQQKALRFVENNRDWIASRRERLPRPRPFTEGDRISIHGAEYVISPRAGRGVTHLADGKLIVYGQPEHLSRRVRNFLKEKAREVTTAAAAGKLARLGLAPKEIRILDPKTRWGSCSPDGRLMFSWRLILAPPVVMDYIVAHEAAHRVHMNHGRKFWALCVSLAEDAEAARKWLKSHGNAIMVYQ